DRVMRVVRLDRVPKPEVMTQLVRGDESENGGRRALVDHRDAALSGPEAARSADASRDSRDRLPDAGAHRDALHHEEAKAVLGCGGRLREHGSELGLG